MERTTQTQSFWRQVSPLPTEKLGQDLTVDACVVGAGIAGLTTALRLVRQGLKVVILDKWELAGGETGLTSAHLSHALDDGFENLKKAHGINGLRLAFESHAWAIDEIERVAAEFSIPCDFGRVER